MSSAPPAPAPRRSGPCLRCTISAIAGLLIGGWMLVMLVRMVRRSMRRKPPLM